VLHCFKKDIFSLFHTTTTYTQVFMMGDSKTYDIPKTCKAGVVSNEGPDFKLSIEDVPVPEPGKPVNTQMKACIADLE
jgi:hypothetical protein